MGGAVDAERAARHDVNAARREVLRERVRAVHRRPRRGTRPDDRDRRALAERTRRARTAVRSSRAPGGAAGSRSRRRARRVVTGGMQLATRRTAVKCETTPDQAISASWRDAPALPLYTVRARGCALGAEARAGYLAFCIITMSPTLISWTDERDERRSRSCRRPRRSRPRRARAPGTGGRPGRPGCSSCSGIRVAAAHDEHAVADLDARALAESRRTRPRPAPIS